MFEDIFLFCLGSSSRLKEYIGQNITLASYIQEKFSVYIQLAKLVPNYSQVVEEAKLINHSKILEILQQRRPDLYHVITTHEHGLKWLKDQKFEEFYKVFL